MQTVRAIKAQDLPADIQGPDIGEMLIERRIQALNLKPGTLWRLLQRLDVLRRPERVEAFVQACECDSRGRLGLEDRAYPQAQYVREAMQVVRGIKAQDLPADIQGPDIGEMLIERRIHALAELKERHTALI